MLENKKLESKIYFANDLIAIYKIFQEQVYNPKAVLYPSCGFDGSPTKVFNDVTFVDIEHGNNGCVAELQKLGLNAIKQDIQEYIPKKEHDLLILLNPAISTSKASKHLQSGGYIISNDYHGNATEMYNEPDKFSLIGTIDITNKMEKEKIAKFSTNLEGLFIPVKNGDELKKYRPDYYEFVERCLQTQAMNSPAFNINRPFEEVWAEYREILQENMPSQRVADRYIFVKK